MLYGKLCILLAESFARLWQDVIYAMACGCAVHGKVPVVKFPPVKEVEPGHWAPACGAP